VSSGTVDGTECVDGDRRKTWQAVKQCCLNTIWVLHMKANTLPCVNTESDRYETGSVRAQQIYHLVQDVEMQLLLNPHVWRIEDGGESVT
jgi:hypothetical protein